MPESLFTGKHEPKHNPQLGTWAAMNWIQRAGVITLFPFYMLSLFCSGKVGAAFGMIGWSAIFLGYVAGNLWRYRHALHFWWSVGVACTVHAFLLPEYAHLTTLMRIAPGRDGKGYMYESFGLLIVEVLLLLLILKRVAMWIHRRMHPAWPESSVNGVS